MKRWPWILLGMGIVIAIDVAQALIRTFWMTI